MKNVIDKAGSHRWRDHWLRWETEWGKAWAKTARHYIVCEVSIFPVKIKVDSKPSSRYLVVLEVKRMTRKICWGGNYREGRGLYASSEDRKKAGSFIASTEEPEPEKKIDPEEAETKSETEMKEIFATKKTKAKWEKSCCWDERGTEGLLHLQARDSISCSCRRWAFWISL